MNQKLLFNLDSLARNSDITRASLQMQEFALEQDKVYATFKSVIIVKCPLLRKIIALCSDYALTNSKVLSFLGCCVTNI